MIFPDKALAIRLENSLALDMKGYVQSFNKLFPDYDASYEEIGGGIAICTGQQFINSAIGMGLDKSVSITDIEKLESFFTSHEAIPYIEICSLTDENFLNLLNARNYHLGEFVTAYTRSLDMPISEAPNPDIVVMPITDSEKGLWADTVMDIQPDSTVDIRLAQAVTNREYTICFLAKVNGQAAGASALSIRDGIATLYFTATRQAYRNQGIQTAMIQARLAYAQAQGCEMAFATTIPGNNSMRNVMRAGFQVAYVRCMMQKAI